MDDKRAVVLAAGKGTRMKSDAPKVLIPVRGRPMIDFVLDALEAAGVRRTVVVVGYRADDVKTALAERKNIDFALQAEQLGTGHAVMSAQAALAGFEGPVLVVTGDSPLIQSSSVAALFEEFERTKPACLMGTAHKDDPTGLGRVVRDANGAFLKIVEEKDATPAERILKEVNMSTYLFNASDLRWALDQVRPDNAQGEYYVTDCPGILKAAGKDVRALAVLKPVESLSVNTVEHLAEVEAALEAQYGV